MASWRCSGANFTRKQEPCQWKTRRGTSVATTIAPGELHHRICMKAGRRGVSSHNCVLTSPPLLTCSTHSVVKGETNWSKVTHRMTSKFRQLLLRIVRCGRTSNFDQQLSTFLHISTFREMSQHHVNKEQFVLGTASAKSFFSFQIAPRFVRKRRGKLCSRCGPTTQANVTVSGERTHNLFKGRA